MKGVLIKNGDNWFIKWNYFHSISSGCHWGYTQLHPTDQSSDMFFKILSDNNFNKEIEVDFIFDENKDSYVKYAKIVYK